MYSPHKREAAMFDIKKVRETAMREGMKLMGNPRVLKLMGTPQGQKVMMLVFQLPQKIQDAFEAQGKRFAKRFKLATRQDLKDLKRSLHDLESALHKMQQAVDANGHKHDDKHKKEHHKHE
jgi:hypothetical protein